MSYDSSNMKTLLEVKDLRTYFFTRFGVVKTIDGVSFSLREGETLGLVGESGCGKSMTCLSIVRLVPSPGKIVGGQIIFEGEDILKKRDSEMRQILGRKISMILQDPMTSLNPLFTVNNQLLEAIRTHDHAMKKPDLWQKAIELLRLVRIRYPRESLHSYPHQLSGGMRQRVVGAMAISCQPRLLIADEPTTSLDITTQTEYLKLLKQIQKETHLTLILVTHDFGIVEQTCDKVAIMYAGRLVEMAEVRELFEHPFHPYTAGLIDSVPRIDVKVEKLRGIKGQPPALWGLPAGCSFNARCSSRQERCNQSPPGVTVADGHWVSCWGYS